MSLYQEMESIDREYFQRFKTGVPARVMRSMPIEEQMRKMREALEAGKPVDWGIETAAPDPDSLLPYEPNP